MGYVFVIYMLLCTLIVTIGAPVIIFRKFKRKEFQKNE